MLWDRGFWAADGDAAKALRKGELRFTLVGEKLQGSWVLVRLRHDREHGTGSGSNAMKSTLDRLEELDRFLLSDR
jgi:bifunctional non-homologous end joining protein LigD